MHQYSTRVESAIRFILKAHEGQTRKGSDLPYVSHLFHVALILQRYGFDEETILAGLLHDAVEDCDVSVQDIESSFGAHVARLVDQVTELPQHLPWEERKNAYLRELENAEQSALAIAAADKIHNLRTITEASQTDNDVWSRFNRGREETLRYYQRVLEVLRRRLDHEIVEEVDQAYQAAKRS